MSDHAEVSVGANITALKTGLAAAKHTLHEFKNEIARDVVGVVGVGAIYEQLKQTAEKFDVVSKKAREFGESVESIQRVQFISSQEDMEFDKVAAAMVKVTKAAVDAEDGNDKLQGAFAKLGISAKEFVNMPMEEKILRLSEGFNDVQGNGEKVALAVSLMGRAGASMLPMLNESTEELSANMKKAVVATAAEVQEMAVLNDNLKELSVNSSSFIGKLASQAVQGFRMMGNAAYAYFDYLKKNYGDMYHISKAALTLDWQGVKSAGSDMGNTFRKFLSDMGNVTGDEVKRTMESMQNAQKNSGKGTGAYEAPEEDTSKKDAKDAEKAEKDREATENRIWALKEKVSKQDFDRLSKEEKLAELRRQLSNEAASVPGSEEETWKRAVNINDIIKEISNTVGQVGGNKATLQGVDSIRDIGGGMGGVNYSNILVSEQGKTNILLAEANKIAAEIKEKTGVTVDFKEAK